MTVTVLVTSVTEEMVAVREKELEESKRKLTVLLAGSRPEEIEASEAENNRLRQSPLFCNCLLACRDPEAVVVEYCRRPRS